MTSTLSSARTGSVALAAGACGWIIVGLVHPRAHRGNLVAQLARLSPHLAAVHLFAIAASIALLLGVVVFSARRGLERLPVLAALLVYAFAAAAFVGAATIDGFLVPGIAISGSSSTAAAVAAQDLIGVCWLAIQVLTKGGLVATAIAIAFWSLDLARERGVRRYVALIGCTVTAGTIWLVVVAQIDAPALVVAGLVQALWYAAIAALLATERASPNNELLGRS